MRSDFVFDDGGMNLLSSSALRAIHAALPRDATLFVFRSGRANLFAAGADMAEMQRFTQELLRLSEISHREFSAV